MRISTQQQYLNSTNNMQRSQNNLARLQEQIETGKKVNKPSDDPIASAQIQKLERELSQYEKYQGNIEVTQRRLDLESSVLDDIHTATDRMRQLAIQAGNDTLTESDRKSIANELRVTADYVAGLMNTQDSQGEYLFAGSKGGIQPYQKSPEGTYTYHGDEGQRMIQVAPDLYLPSNDSGRYLFESADDEYVFSKPGDPAISGHLTFPTDREPVYDEATFEPFIQQAGDLTVSVYMEKQNPFDPLAAQTYGYRVTDSGGNEIVGDTTLGDLAQPVEVQINGLRFNITEPRLEDYEFDVAPVVNGVTAVDATDKVQAKAFTDEHGFTNYNVEFLAATGIEQGRYQIRDAANNLVEINGETDFAYNNDQISFSGFTLSLATGAQAPTVGGSFEMRLPLEESISNVDDTNIRDSALYNEFASSLAGSEFLVEFDTDNGDGVTGYEIFSVNGGVETSLGTFTHSFDPNVPANATLDLQYNVAGVPTDTGLSLTLDLDNIQNGERASIRVEDDATTASESEHPSADVVIHTEDGRRNVLDIAINLAEALEAGITESGHKLNMSDVTTDAIEQFKVANERVLTAQTAIGSRLGSLEEQLNTNMDFELFTNTTLSSIQDLDYTEAITQLRLEEVILQASQATFTRVANLSLFDHL